MIDNWSVSYPGTLAVMTVPLAAGGIRSEIPISCTVLANRRMTSAYAGSICRRLRCLGGSWRPPGLSVFDRKILSGPNESKNVIMPARNPVSRDATQTTVVIPITMPRIVRPERNRCVQTADMAIVMFSLGEMFITQPALLNQPLV